MKAALAAALGGYAGVMTLAVGYLALTAAAPGVAIPRVLDVERINVREPDGTLRLAMSNHARIPGIIVAGHETPHPNRSEAGLIFYNDEGTENGGLVFDGRLKGGRPTNGGSLTFDRWRQDQTIQVSSVEDGDSRDVSLRINDRPDRPLDLSNVAALRAMPEGPAKKAAYEAAGLGVAQRAYLGRNTERESELALKDAAGRPRLVLRVTARGDADIRFLDAAGNVVRHVSPTSSSAVAR